MTEKELRKKAMALPLQPGVYIMKNKDKKIVYYPKIDLDNRNKEEKSEFWENWNKSQVKKQIKTDRLENLNIASRDNQIFD